MCIRDRETIARIGENMTFRRMHVLEGSTVVSYVHNSAADGMGKIGVLVALNGPAEAAEAIGKQFAMHIAATSPLSLSEATMDPAVVERELAVQTAKALEENATAAKPKPEQVLHNNIIPVSYTHLDVYKRQDLSCVDPGKSPLIQSALR